MPYLISGFEFEEEMGYRNNQGQERMASNELGKNLRDIVVGVQKI